MRRGLAAMLSWLWPRRELREREPLGGRMAEVAARAAARSAGRSDPAPRHRLVGRRHADRERGRAVRLSAVCLLLHWRDQPPRAGCWSRRPRSSWRCPIPCCCWHRAWSPGSGERGILIAARGRRRCSALARPSSWARYLPLVQGSEWHAKTYRLGASSYASLYFVTTGFHMAHVIIGLLVLAALFVWTALDYFSPRRRSGRHRPACCTGTSSTSCGCSYSRPTT